MRREYRNTARNPARISETNSHNPGGGIGSELSTEPTIAVINGFKAEQIRDYLGSDTDVEKVMAEVTQAQEIGVTGVPTFILGSRYGVVGAQSPEYLAQSIRKAAAG